MQPDSPPQQLLHLVIGGEHDLSRIRPSRTSTRSRSSAFIRTTHRPMPFGRRRRSRRLITPTCGISSCTSIGCSILVKIRSPPIEKLLRNLLRSRGFQQFAGLLAAGFLWLVWRTNRFSYDPEDVYDIVEPQMPVILAFWHGQHFMTPFIKREEHRGKV